MAEVKKIQGKFSDLQKIPSSHLHFQNYLHPLPKKVTMRSWGKDFAVWVSQNSKLELLRDPLTQLVSLPNETENEFRQRIDQKRREVRDDLVAETSPKICSKSCSNSRQDEKSPACG